MIGALYRDLRIIRLGVVGELRNPAFRLIGLAVALAAAAYAWGQGSTAGSTALALTAWGGRSLALAACLWFATAALRDQDARLGAVLRSKPVDGGRWVLLLWATGVGVWLTLLACLFLGAMVGQVRWAGLTAVSAHMVGFLRAGLMVVALATLGFGLSRLTRSPLGAAAIVLAFLCVMAGLQFVPPYLRPDFTQNLPLFLAAGAALLALTGPVAERWRRGELRKPLLPIAGFLGCVALAVGGAGMARQAIEAPAEGTVAEMMTRQSLQKGRRLPGFWLPDGRGGTVRTAAYPGQILLVYLFAADDLEAAKTLPSLQGVLRDYKARGVQPLAVALSQDRGDASALAWSANYSFPVAGDPHTVRVTAPTDGALIQAYGAETLPMLVVTDRSRTVRETLQESSYSPERLRQLVEARLAEEPE